MLAATMDTININCGTAKSGKKFCNHRQPVLGARLYVQGTIFLWLGYNISICRKAFVLACL